MATLLAVLESSALQLPAQSQPPVLWDVTVVGAGPAGSMAAGHLAKRGYRVLLLDKLRFPRDKPCGDALIPDAIQALRRAGLYEEVCAAGHSWSQISLFSPSRIEVTIPGELLTLKRRVLDALLARWAVGCGAVFCQGAVTGLSTQTDGSVQLRLQGMEQALRTRMAVLATGADVRLLQRMEMVLRPGPSALAARCYVTSAKHIDRLIISYDRSILPGYAWIFPLGNQEYNVGCGVFYRNGRSHAVNLRERFRSFLEAFPPGRELMQQKTACTELQGHPLRCGLSGARIVGPANTVAIGETIGATFPFTGEGIGKAMETAELASEAIDRALRSGNVGELRRLAARVEEDLLPRFQGYKIAERWLSYSRVNDLVAWRARRSPYLRGLLSGVLNETVDPRQVFSLRGLAKSLWA